MTGNEEFPPTPGGGSSDGDAGLPAGEAAGSTPPPAAPAPAVKAGGQTAGKAPKEPKTPKAPKAAGAKAGGGKAGRNVAIAVGVAALLVVVGAAAEPYAPGATEIKLAMSGDSATINADTLKDLKFTVTGGKKDMVLKLDGQKVEGTREGNVTTYEVPDDLAEGDHTFLATSKGRLPGRKVTEQKSFSVDKTAPVLTLDAPTAKDLRSPVTLSGKAEGASEVKIGDEVVELKDGAFSKTFANAVSGVTVTARDAAGNTVEQVADVAVQHPGMRAVHMTAIAWGYKPLKDPVVQMLKDKKIDTIELDVKDEDGHVGYASEVQMAKDAGAIEEHYKIDDAVKEIHDLGGRVVGRIVAFRDPKLAKWAIQTGKTDMIIQDTSGNPYNAGTYGAASFTNFANADVRKYNIDLGVEAATHGFDDIMFDYIRRPEAHPTLTNQHFPGLGDKDPGVAIADFLGEAQPQIRGAGAFLGAAVFGISSFGPSQVAQNVPLMAKHVDYLSPMVYPSHWGKGEYSVPVPNSAPYDIVNRSLKDFNRQVLGTHAQIIPWLQDFTLGPPSYGAPEVAAQIKAAHDDGINSFLLWNAVCKFTPAALDTIKDHSDVVSKDLVYSINKPGNNSEGTKDAVEAKKFIDTYYAYAAVGKRSEFVWPLPAGTVVPGSTTPAVEASTEASSSGAPATATASPSTEPSASPTP